MYSSNSPTSKVWLSILKLPIPTSDLFHTDLENKRIYIAQQLANDLTLRESKSENAHRWIGLDDKTTEYLQSWKELQQQQLADMDIEQKPSTPVVTNELGGTTDPNNFSR